MSSVDGATKRCPQCHRDTLAFTRRYPVLTAAAAMTRTGTDPHDGPDRLHYESAWVCQNRHCDYRAIIGDQ
jgi:hypothetical protein